jgi:Family of unknown function (DUF5946)
MSSDEELYHELSYYTLAHPDPSFIHQHLVDAHAAQHADASAKPIGVIFALIGLYLHVEKGFTGRQVQRAHMQLAKRRKQWPAIEPPAARGTIAIADVVAVPAGPERDAMIHHWCAAVWEAWKPRQDEIVELVRNELGVA